MSRRKRELTVGCVVSPSAIGPTYVPLVISVLTYEGVPAGRYRIEREMPTAQGNTPDEAFRTARKMIKEKF